MDHWDRDDEPEAADGSADLLPWEYPDYAVETASPRRPRHTPMLRCRPIRAPQFTKPRAIPWETCEDREANRRSNW